MTIIYAVEVPMNIESDIQEGIYAFTSPGVSGDFIKTTLDKLCDKKDAERKVLSTSSGNFFSANVDSFKKKSIEKYLDQADLFSKLTLFVKSPEDVSYKIIVHKTYLT